MARVGAIPNEEKQMSVKTDIKKALSELAMSAPPQQRPAIEKLSKALIKLVKLVEADKKDSW